jgi:hypothetical protein
VHCAVRASASNVGAWKFGAWKPLAGNRAWLVRLRSATRLDRWPATGAGIDGQLRGRLVGLAWLRNVPRPHGGIQRDLHPRHPLAPSVASRRHQ